MVLYEITMRQVPFPEEEDLFRLGIDIRDNGTNPTLGKHVHEFYIELMDRCWAFDHCDRPSFQEIVDYIYDLSRDERVQAAKVDRLKLIK